MLTVVGAGAVGLVIGARLARSGREVLFVTRSAAAARAIDREGVHFEDPAIGEGFRAAARAVDDPGAAAAHIGAGPVLFCTRLSDLDTAARGVAAVAPEAIAASFQNDVDGEERLAAFFPRVIGAVVRQTCTRTAPNAAVATGAGRLVLGTHPSGACEHTRSLANDLRAAGYDVGVSERIAEDAWLKLCINLMSAPNALVRRDDHATHAFVEIKARLLEEARAALSAEGIVARSCDGRDRALDEEITWQRASLAQGTSARRLPLYNQVWSALRSGGPLEADRYHRRILELCDEHRLPAPQNALVLEALERAEREKTGPESLAADALLA